MTVTAAIKKWGPEYVTMLALATLAYDFIWKDGGEPWTLWDIVLIMAFVFFANAFLRDPVLFRLPGSVKGKGQR